MSDSDNSQERYLLLGRDDYKIGHGPIEEREREREREREVVPSRSCCNTAQREPSLLGTFGVLAKIRAAAQEHLPRMPRIEPQLLPTPAEGNRQGYGSPRRTKYKPPKRTNGSIQLATFLYFDLILRDFIFQPFSYQLLVVSE